MNKVLLQSDFLVILYYSLPVCHNVLKHDGMNSFHFHESKLDEYYDDDDYETDDDDEENDVLASDSKKKLEAERQRQEYDQWLQEHYSKIKANNDAAAMVGGESKHDGEFLFAVSS